MESNFVAIAGLIKEPLLIFILCVIAIMAALIFSLLKLIKAQVVYERELVSELGQNSQTLIRLATLIEALVHGKGGSKR
jgi:hypothetical protein